MKCTVDIFELEGGRRQAEYFGSRPLWLSYSALKNLWTCPAKYALANVLRLVPKTVDTRNFCLGSVGHACLERWVKEGNLSPGYMASIAQAEFDDNITKNVVIPLHKHDIYQMRAKAVVNAQAIEDTMTAYGLADKTLVSEGYLKVPLPGSDSAMLVGIVDLRVIEDGSIYDLKVTKNATFMDRDQLCIYCMMGEIAGYGSGRAGFIVPLRKERVVTMNFGESDYLAMLDRIHEAMDTIENGLDTGQWEANPGCSDCYWCGVAGLCAANRQLRYVEQ